MRRELHLIATTLLFLFALLPMSASAQRRQSDVDAQRQRVNSLGKELVESDKRVKAISKERSSASRRVQELNRQINLRSSYIAETEYELELVEEEILSLTHSIDSLEVAFEQSRSQYAEMVRQAYRMRRRNTYASYLFSSSSLEELSRRMADVERIAERYRDVAYLARQQRDELGLLREMLETRRYELDSIGVSLSNERSALQGDRNEANSIYVQLTERERAALDEQKATKRRYDEASAELERILAENTVGSSFSSNTRGLKLPIEGGKVRPLQANMIEISGRRGSAVRCVEAGTVGEITQSTGDLYIVKIAHGKDFFTIYTHVSQVCVKVGQRVEENEKIGTAGVFVDYDNSERSFIQFMVHNHRTGELEEVMKFFSKK